MAAIFGQFPANFKFSEALDSSDSCDSCDSSDSSDSSENNSIIIYIFPPTP